MNIQNIPSILSIVLRIRELENKIQTYSPKTPVLPPPLLSNSMENMATKKSTDSSFESLLFPNKDRETIQDKINSESIKNGLEPELVRAVIQAESNFNPKAISPKGAQGLMQLMPSTSIELGVDDPMDPLQNIEGGTRYLAELMQTFQDRKLALAAYNAGPGTIKKHGGVPPIKETQDYVEKIESLFKKSKSIEDERIP